MFPAEFYKIDKPNPFKKLLKYKKTLLKYRVAQDNGRVSTFRKFARGVRSAGRTIIRATALRQILCLGHSHTIKVDRHISNSQLDLGRLTRRGSDFAEASILDGYVTEYFAHNLPREVTD